MRRFMLIVIGMLFALAVPLFADTKSSINGSIETHPLFTFKDGTISFNRNILSLKFEGSGNSYHYFSEVDAISPGLPDPQSSLSDLGKRGNVDPLDIEINEGYIDLYGFPINAIDLRVGKQIIVWGTADKINPTSNLCPADLSDTFDFGKKIGVNSLLMNLYMRNGNVIFSTIYIPAFSPTLLPADFSQFAGVSFGTPTLNFPSEKLGKSSQIALKLSLPIGTFNLSTSYYYGRYHIPSVYEVTIDNPITQHITESKLFFPKVQVIGSDFSGSLFNMGIWGEAGYFIPQSYTSNAIYSGMPVSQTKMDDHYLRYVLGTDYTFKNGLYYNLQFVHGFDTEITKDALKDYFIGRVEKSYFNDKVKILPLTFVFTTGDWNNLENNYGISWIPEIDLFPEDNLEINLGAYLINGVGDNLMSNLKDKDSLFIKAKVSF